MGAPSFAQSAKGGRRECLHYRVLAGRTTVLLAASVPTSRKRGEKWGTHVIGGAGKRRSNCSISVSSLRDVAQIAALKCALQPFVTLKNC